MFKVIALVFTVVLISKSACGAVIPEERPDILKDLGAFYRCGPMALQEPYLSGGPKCLKEYADMMFFDGDRIEKDLLKWSLKYEFVIYISASGSMKVCPCPFTKIN